MIPGKFLLRSFFLIVLLFFGAWELKAQGTPDFARQWKSVDSLVKKGLTRSALAEVTIIYRNAHQKGNEPQVIKALLYQTRLRENFEEQAGEHSIDSMELEISNAREPARSILESITAGLYWQYFQYNRYRIYGRTPTSGWDKKEIATWTAADLNKRIGELFSASIKESALLKRISIEAYAAILTKGNAERLRPTLFDLLAHRALDYFKNDEASIQSPASTFTIKDPRVFSPANQFIHLNLRDKDSASQQQEALLILQQLIAFHLGDKNPDALIDIDLERLSYVYQKGEMPQIGLLYLEALRQISRKYAGNPASAEASLRAAQFIFSQAGSRSGSSTTASPYTIIQAKKLLDSIIIQFPDSPGGTSAYNLRQQILHPDLRLSTEKVNIPGLAFRTLVSYKNFHTLYFRLIALGQKTSNDVLDDDDNDSLFARLSVQKTLRSWTQELPAKSDYLSHCVEVKIDGLPPGQYLLLGSIAPGFGLSENAMAAAHFYVSNISFISSGRQYFVLNRTTGAPLVHTEIKVYQQRENDRSWKQPLKYLYPLFSNQDGYFELPQGKKNQQTPPVRLDISYKKDRLFLDDYQYNYYYNWNNEGDDQDQDQEDYDDTHAKVFLFTDRSIYRPGQWVYFKGIGITQNWKSHQPQLLKTGDSLSIILLDAGGQKIDSMQEKLNDYGSFHGAFQIPSDRLTGNYQIEVVDYSNSSVSFSVEEYKRPKFYTEFQKVKGSYRLGDTVRVTGFAKGYAGDPVDGARVTYRITRNTRFFYPWLFRGGPLPRSTPAEIAHGTLVTHADGSFVISFAALADLSQDRGTDPVFDYTIQTDVTDINGETRSGDIQVAVGYKALLLQIDLPQDAITDIDSLRYLGITAKNLSDQPESLAATVSIYELKGPQRLIRKRLWQIPDEHIYTKAEYTRYFPHDEYANELDKSTWARGARLYHQRDTTGKDSAFLIKGSILHPGWYEIEATAKDPYGQEVKDVRYLQVYDPKATKPPAPSYLWMAGGSPSYAPGDTLRLTTASSADSVYLIREIDQTSQDDKEAPRFQPVAIDDHVHHFQRPITEADRGGFTWNAFFVKDNRFYAERRMVSVPWSNKSLQISFDTYRDKTLPGSKESWKVTIRGNHGQKVAAEMLASMYDGSLDQFQPHYWILPSLWPSNYGTDLWSGNQNFSEVNSFIKSRQEALKTQEEKLYPSLIFSPVSTPLQFLTGRVPGLEVREVPSPGLIGSKGARLDEVVVTGYGIAKAQAPAILEDTMKVGAPVQQPPGLPFAQIRKDFNETAFFYPELRTDSAGSIRFDFTLPESITRWKLMTLAHTRDLAFGFATRTLITQKELMVQPGVPRFLRQGDTLECSAKVINLSSQPQKGTVSLQLFSASSMTPVDGAFDNSNPSREFYTAPGQSTAVAFRIAVPKNFTDALTYRIVAQSTPEKSGEESFSDGEEASIPVLANRMLVTESLPLEVQGTGSRSFTFEKLLHSAASHSLIHHGISVEYSANPVWYAVGALPFLMDDPYQCSEQTFNRFYSNALATEIVDLHPSIKTVFEKWSTRDTSALLSNLQKNEALKSVLLQETPWVLDAKNETDQKKNIALLFDLAKMSQRLHATLREFGDLQIAGGGFAWFKGGPVDRYITQYILSGIGHLEKLQAIPREDSVEISKIVKKALPFTDHLVEKDFEALVRQKSNLGNNHLSNELIQYLYMRSFFPQYPLEKNALKALSYYRGQAAEFWISQSRYLQAMIALSLYRSGDTSHAMAIMNSLKENSVHSNDMGMYWKEWDRGGYWWYNAPIESQALMVEAFSEIVKDPIITGQLKLWLLKNKQTHNWKTTKATADACYALLLQGSARLQSGDSVSIELGNMQVQPSREDQQAGSGYFIKKIAGKDVTDSMGNIRVTVFAPDTSSLESLQANPSWGAVYWQYFEDPDRITFSKTPLRLSKALFIEKNTDSGPLLYPLKDGDLIHIGDKIKVRIELQVDRDMEYVHMKDLRASGMQTVNVLSGYHYQDGLGYYESTRDASTDFFFSYLPKGTYVFEYPLFAAHAGNFSNGITTIQSMYAPEFTSHSEGIRVKIVP